MIRKKRYVIISIFFVVTIHGTRAIRYALSTINSCTIHVSPALSCLCAQQLSVRVQQLSHERPAHLFSCLQKEYPCVKNMSCRYNAHHVMTVSLDAAKPLLRLNDEQLILENKQCVPVAWYNDDCLDVPRVTTASDSSIQAITTFFEQMPVVMSKRFSSEWHNDFSIHLHDTVHKGSELIASVDAVPTIDTLKAYDKIIEDYKKYTIDEKEKNEKWVADARFANQLIFSTKKEA